MPAVSALKNCHVQNFLEVSTVSEVKQPLCKRFGSGVSSDTAKKL
jgi:hypothetical protein